MVKKISREEQEQEEQEELLYDSRSSLRSELSDLQRRPATNLSQCDDVSLRSEASNTKIRELRQQVLKLQQRGSENVKEVVMKDKLIAELQTQITFLNSERDELRNENNANLSVIQRLKDNLNDTKTRLSVLEEDSESSQYERKVSSSASLPEMPAFQQTYYTSKFARSLTRQSNHSSLVQQLSDQLDIARKEKQQLEDQMRDVLAQMEISNTERLSLEDQLIRVKTELEDLVTEHDNLKDDFRTLVRKYEVEKERKKSAGKSVLADDTTVLSKTKMLHEAHRGQEVLLATEEKLEAAIVQLQQREREMGNVAHHLENINQQLFDRDIELGKEGSGGNFLTLISSISDNQRGEIGRLEQELSETLRDNEELKETIDGQKLTILSLQAQAVNVEEKRKSEPRKSSQARTVRLIYKDSDDLSGDEGLSRAQYSNNNTPKSFLMSSSDSFEI